MSAVKRVEFISDRVSYTKLKGYWCYVVLNVRSPTEDKNITVLLRTRVP
jgi:hypothetical protein